MDSILNYPLYYAIVQGFTIPGPGNMSDVSTVMGQIQNSFKVCHIHLTVAMTNLSR
jgi:alpha-amylase